MDDLVEANRRYAEGFAHGDLQAPPTRRVAVVTCMDARMDPEAFLGLGPGDAHVIRNAGGRASDDALRSLVISSTLLGTREAAVIHHTGCGMATFANEDLRGRLRDERGDAAGDAADALDFLPFGDAEASVRDDVERIRTSPMLADDFTVTGWMYEVETGRIRSVDG